MKLINYRNLGSGERGGRCSRWAMREMHRREFWHVTLTGLQTSGPGNCVRYREKFNSARCGSARLATCALITIDFRILGIRPHRREKKNANDTSSLPPTFRAAIAAVVRLRLIKFGANRKRGNVSRVRARQEKCNRVLTVVEKGKQTKKHDHILRVYHHHHHHQPHPADSENARASSRSFARTLLRIDLVGSKTSVDKRGVFTRTRRDPRDAGPG